MRRLGLAIERAKMTAGFRLSQLRRNNTLLLGSVAILASIFLSGTYLWRHHRVDTTARPYQGSLALVMGKIEREDVDWAHKLAPKQVYRDLEYD